MKGHASLWFFIFNGRNAGHLYNYHTRRPERASLNFRNRRFFHSPHEQLKKTCLISHCANLRSEP